MLEKMISDAGLLLSLAGWHVPLAHRWAATGRRSPLISRHEHQCSCRSHLDRPFIFTLNLTQLQPFVAAGVRRGLGKLVCYSGRRGVVAGTDASRAYCSLLTSYGSSEPGLL